jgi:hypothetical protein
MALLRKIIAFRKETVQVATPQLDNQVPETIKKKHQTIA